MLDNGTFHYHDVHWGGCMSLMWIERHTWGAPQEPVSSLGPGQPKKPSVLHVTKAELHSGPSVEVLLYILWNVEGLWSEPETYEAPSQTQPNFNPVFVLFCWQDLQICDPGYSEVRWRSSIQVTQRKSHCKHTQSDYWLCSLYLNQVSSGKRHLDFFWGRSRAGRSVSAPPELLHQSNSKTFACWRPGGFSQGICCVVLLKTTRWSHSFIFF